MSEDFKDREEQAESVKDAFNNKDDLTENSEAEMIDEEITEEEFLAAKEAKKMKLRKILYPIAIILIIWLWISSLTGNS